MVSRDALPEGIENGAAWAKLLAGMAGYKWGFAVQSEAIRTAAIQDDATKLSCACPLEAAAKFLPFPQAGKALGFTEGEIIRIAYAADHISGADYPIRRELLKASGLKDNPGTVFQKTGGRFKE